MKKRVQHVLLSDHGEWRNPRTGDHCPMNGWWAPINHEATQCFIAQGSLMPSVKGLPTRWKLMTGDKGQWRPSHDIPKSFVLDSLGR